MSEPTYHLITTVNGHVLGDFQAPIPDPFHRTTVTVGWRDVLRALLRRRRVVVEVSVGGDPKTIEAVMALNPNHLGPEGSPSRKAWNAHLNEALSRIGADRP